jgi:hypothetical protein
MILAQTGVCVKLFAQFSIDANFIPELKAACVWVIISFTYSEMSHLARFAGRRFDFRAA